MKFLVALSAVYLLFASSVFAHSAAPAKSKANKPKKSSSVGTGGPGGSCSTCRQYCDSTSMNYFICQSICPTEVCHGSEANSEVANFGGLLPVAVDSDINLDDCVRFCDGCCTSSTATCHLCLGIACPHDFCDEGHEGRKDKEKIHGSKKKEDEEDDDNHFNLINYSMTDQECDAYCTNCCDDKDAMQCGICKSLCGDHCIDSTTTSTTQIDKKGLLFGAPVAGEVQAPSAFLVFIVLFGIGLLLTYGVYRIVSAYKQTHPFKDGSFSFEDCRV